MASAEWLISSVAGNAVENAHRGDATAAPAMPMPDSSVATRDAKWRRDKTPDRSAKGKSKFLEFSIMSSAECVQQSRDADSRRHGSTGPKYVQENIFGFWCGKAYSSASNRDDSRRAHAVSRRPPPGSEAKN